MFLRHAGLTEWFHQGRTEVTQTIKTLDSSPCPYHAFGQSWEHVSEIQECASQYIFIDDVVMRKYHPLEFGL